MPTKSYDTNDWKLTGHIVWQPKYHSVECVCCNGTGSVGGGFKDIDGPRPCPDCRGARIQTKGPSTPEPPVPAELVEHLRRAWWDFFNKPETP